MRSSSSVSLAMDPAELLLLARPSQPDLPAGLAGNRTPANPASASLLPTDLVQPLVVLDIPLQIFLQGLVWIWFFAALLLLGLIWPKMFDHYSLLYVDQPDAV
ncbi:hypothetical protein BRADI_3g44315v3 [Brachypodium distachyon]|uniref:Uncharacterized protein n=1 Tax=Brachypodium distachyon TaxID=15368 RepID=A0A0Q3M520_BRADI|nr:hypothetical protein BRADI_3g44315v3 [Brachypodium distachyon]